MTNCQITQLTPTMPAVAHQAAQLLHAVFAPQGSWETIEEAIQEVQDMLTPERMVWVAIVGEEVVGWIGGVPHYDAMCGNSTPWWSARPGNGKALAAG